MSRSPWVKGPVCGTDNCRSRLYRSQDGLKICQFGHVLEGAIEINDEQDEGGGGYVQTRRLNTVSVDEYGNLASVARSNNKSIKSTSDRLIGEDAVTLYLRCLQVLLKQELNQFITLFFSEGVRKDLTLIVKKNWVKLLSSDGQTLDALDLVCLIYLSALELQAYPIYIADLIENIKSNNIPYIRTLHLIPKTMLDKLPTTYHNKLQPFSLPENGKIFKRLHSVGTRVTTTLKISLSFYFPYIFRVLSECFLLPNTPDLFISCYMLLRDTPYFEITFTSTFNQFITKFPEIYIASVIIFVIKENFQNKGFNGWLKELNQFELSNEYNSNKNAVLDWSDDKIDKYCDWIYDNIIPKKHKLNDDTNDERLNTMEKRLFQIFNLENDTNKGDEQKERGETAMYTVIQKIMQTDEQHDESNVGDLNRKLDNTFTNLLGL